MFGLKLKCIKLITNNIKLRSHDFSSRQSPIKSMHQYPDCVCHNLYFLSKYAKKLHHKFDCFFLSKYSVLRVLKCCGPMCVYPFVTVFLEIRQSYFCHQGHTYFILQHPNSLLWYYLNFLSFASEKLWSILTFLMEKRESSDKIKVRTFSNNYMYNCVP